MRLQRAMFFYGQFIRNRFFDDGASKKPGLLAVCRMAALVNVNSRKSCSVTKPLRDHLKRFG